MHYRDLMPFAYIIRELEAHRSIGDINFPGTKLIVDAARTGRNSRDARTYIYLIDARTSCRRSARANERYLYICIILYMGIVCARTDALWRGARSTCSQNLIAPDG